MSILIKGMKMPPNCLQCYCTDTEYGECVLDTEKRCPEDYGQRAEWCPLISVPPHGDLIDRDELIERAWRLNLSTRELIETMLKTAPTILEAEVEE